MKRKNNKITIKKHLSGIIFKLLDLIDKYPEYRKEYTYIISMLSRKFLFPLPKNIKRKICKNCGCYYKVWKTRIKNGYIIHKCPNCGYIKCINIKKELQRSTLEKKD